MSIIKNINLTLKLGFTKISISSTIGLCWILREETGKGSYMLWACIAVHRA